MHRAMTTPIPTDVQPVTDPPCKEILGHPASVVMVWNGERVPLEVAQVAGALKAEVLENQTTSNFANKS